MQQPAQVLPFRYMAGCPVEVLTGQLDAPRLWTGLAFQSGWLLVELRRPTPGHSTHPQYFLQAVPESRRRLPSW